MTFNQLQYIAEMKAMVDEAIEQMRNEYPDWEVYTISIWTDPGAEASAVSFDSKAHSDQETGGYNQLMKRYSDSYLEKKEYEKAKRYIPVEGRNDNPADFELHDLRETRHTCFSIDWEEETEDEVWDILEPNLQEVGEYAFRKSQLLKRHPEFELGINGRSDWYEIIWHKPGEPINRIS